MGFSLFPLSRELGQIACISIRRKCWRRLKREELKNRPFWRITNLSRCPPEKRPELLFSCQSVELPLRKPFEGWSWWSFEKKLRFGDDFYCSLVTVLHFFSLVLNHVNDFQSFGFATSSWLKFLIYLFWLVLQISKNLWDNIYSRSNTA